MQTSDRRRPERVGPLTVPHLRETEELEAAWQRTLIATTRFQLLLTAVLTLSALIIGYFILPNVPIGAFLAVIGWVAFSTLVTGWLSALAGRRGREGSWVLRLSLFSSILTVTLVTYLVGEARGDFYLIYFLPIITAGIYFGLRGALLTAIVGGASYLFLAHLAVGITGPLMATLILRVSFFFLIAAAVGLLAEGQRYLIDGLCSAVTRATQLAMIDSLTGIFNRRYVTTYLEEELARSQRSGGSVTLLSISPPSPRTPQPWRTCSPAPTRPSTAPRTGGETGCSLGARSPGASAKSRSSSPRGRPPRRPESGLPTPGRKRACPPRRWLGVHPLTRALP